MCERTSYGRDVTSFRRIVPDLGGFKLTEITPGIIYEYLTKRFTQISERTKKVPAPRTLEIAETVAV